MENVGVATVDGGVVSGMSAEDITLDDLAAQWDDAHFPTEEPADVSPILEARAVEVLAALDIVVAAIDQVNVCSATNKQLVEYVTTLSAKLQVVSAHLWDSVDEIDVRGASEEQENLRTGQWVAHHFGIRSTDAHRIISRQRDLRRLPRTRGAWLDGEITQEQAHQIALGVRQTTGDARETYCANEDKILDVSRDKSCEDIETIRRRVVEHLRPEDADAKDAARLHRRGFSFTQGADGELSAVWNIDPEGAGRLLAAVDALTPPPAQDDDRSLAQRRSDGLIDGISALLDHAHLPKKAGQRPHIVVTLSGDTLRGFTDAAPAEMDWVGPIATATAQRLLCDCAVSYILANSPSQPIDVGREFRLVTEAQRRLVVHRDKHCVYEGCQRPSYWCEVHHLVPWQHGGRTDFHHLALTCRYHHVKIHQQGVEVIRGADGSITLRKPRRGGEHPTPTPCPHTDTPPSNNFDGLFNMPASDPEDNTTIDSTDATARTATTHPIGATGTPGTSGAEPKGTAGAAEPSVGSSGSDTAERTTRPVYPAGPTPPSWTAPPTRTPIPTRTATSNPGSATTPASTTARGTIRESLDSPTQRNIPEPRSTMRTNPPSPVTNRPDADPGHSENWGLSDERWAGARHAGRVAPGGLGGS